MGMKQLIVATILMVSSLNVASADDAPGNIKAQSAPIAAAGSCVDVTNLGTNNPKLMNRCDEAKTVKVVNYDRNGVLVAERIFHLWQQETRPVAFPGYQMFIEWEKGWTNDGPDDGSRFITLMHHDLGGSDLWEARNSSSDRFNAAQFIVYTNGRRTSIAWIVLPPGQSARIYAFTPPDTGALILEWSRLDPL